MNSPPVVFSPARTRSSIARANDLSLRGETAWYLIDEMADDLFERLAFLRHEPSRVLLDGFGSAALGEAPWAHDVAFDDTGDADLASPLPFEGSTFELVASINALDKVDDVPGALIQMRELLAPGGLAMATFVAAPSLTHFRRAVLAGEPDRPAARMHPQIDPRSCQALLARAGWGDPVVDTHSVTVRFSSFDRVVQDLREHGLGNMLASPAPFLTRNAVARMRDAYAAMAEEDGKVTERFEIVTLTGRRPPARR